MHDDEVKAALERARGYAGALQPVLTKDRAAELKDRAARAFFDEEGIPHDLKQGWVVLEERREQRAKVGFPLPPGGRFFMSYQTVVAGCLAEVHSILCNWLKLPADAIRMRLALVEGIGGSQYKPVADFEIPKDWILPVSGEVVNQVIGSRGELRPDEAAKKFIEQSLAAIQDHYQKIVRERIAAVDMVRPELLQPIR
jgi:hypothetical protein